MRNPSNSPCFEMYLNQIGSIPLLTRDEEVRLAQLCQQGDRKAEEQLVKANLRFVVHVAKLYSWSDVAPEDLVSAGNLGLAEAVRKFDPSQGFRFISYAVWQIQKYIREEVAKFQHIISSSTIKESELYAIRKALESAIAVQGGKPLTPAQIDELGISETQIAEAYNHITHLSLDSAFEESDRTLHDVLVDQTGPSPDAAIVHEQRERMLQQLFSGLTEQEAAIYSLLHGLGEGGQRLTPMQIGEKLGIPTYTVRARISTAERKLKNAVKEMKARGDSQSSTK